VNTKQTYCGNIAIIGKVNVGKSTLINQIIEKKISIVSRKKNTTQSNIIGIKTQKYYQSIYIDTPGVISEKKFFFHKTIKNLTLIIFVVDRLFWTKDDENILNRIKKNSIPIIIVINKIDKIKNKEALLPFINFLKKKNITTEIIPISAKNTKSAIELNKIIQSYLPKNPHIYPKDYITENSHFFTVSEIIRETLILFLRDELPSMLKVKIERFQIRGNKQLYIRAIILVKNIRQKKIIIGTNGEKIKKISIRSRFGIEKEFAQKTHLILWVKVNL